MRKPAQLQRRSRIQRPRRGHGARAAALAAVIATAVVFFAASGAAPVPAGDSSEVSLAGPADSAEEDDMALDIPIPAAETTSDADTDVAVTSADSAPPVGWLHTDGATLRTVDNEVHVIRAVSWFGMETSNCAPHGLWSISLDAGLTQIRAMGFNTIRLPFSNECLASATTNSINYTANPTLQGMSALQVMDAVIATAKSMGLSVILDRHRPASAAQSELWYTSQYTEAQWITDWQSLAARYVAEPTVIGFDLHNEPHGAACWGCGNPATDWPAAATRAGDAVLAVNPNVLIIVEGVENQPDGSSSWWGGGLAGVEDAPVTLNVPGRLVYSPHDYPASVYPQSWFSAADYPNNLPAVWDTQWGYIAKSGIAPVLLGEFGTTLTTSSDQQWLATMVDYLADTGISFSYWSFNPNSGDTGGLVQDDWTTPQVQKLAALAPLLTPSVPVGAATPPVTSPSGAPQPPSRPSPSVSTPVPSAVASPTGTSAGAPTVQAEWSLQNSWDAGYAADIVITSATGAGSWMVSWIDPAVVRVANAWGIICVVAPGGVITCEGSGWATSPVAGQTYRVGLQVEGAAAPVSPTLTVSAR